MITETIIVAGIVFLLATACLRAEENSKSYTEASWYGHEFEGKPMANGKPFVPNNLTCASWDFPLGTWLKVEHQKKSVFVQVTDRGPAKRLVKKGRRLDLSIGAWKKLGLDPTIGVARVKISEDNS